ncbi:MAG: trypsin-like peptidase domain-containing protein [Anaerolineae bacterium]|nr:MAG: trypsin-like peptidase domain-containing protein [Anaerolineae bacterium]
MAEVLQQLNLDMSSVVEDVRRSLVQISNGWRGAGAGTIWHSDGLILTNAHVVGRRSLQVTLPDAQKLPARLLAHDRRLDLAALNVDATALPTIELGNSKRLQPGQWVLALGHPWGVPGAATAGVVIGVGPSPEMPLPQRELIQVSLHLRPGYSGGPLVDVKGRLLGINTMMAGPDVGLAVPVHEVKAFLRRALGS